MKTKAIIIFFLLFFISTSAFGCRVVDKKTKEAMKPITLEYWGVFNDKSDFSDLFSLYQKKHPYITIKYRKFRYNEYEKELLNAFAEDRGPDLFSINSVWLREYQNKLSPMPKEITMAYPVLVGKIKKQIIPELRTTKSLTLNEIKEKFIDIVYNDVVLDTIKDKQIKKEVFGLPLYVDTLVLYYNRDLLNNAGISEVPKYWNKEFQNDVIKLTKQTAKGKIQQAGVALGGSHNIERASDILSILMIQNGTIMMSNKRIFFHIIPKIFENQGFYPGAQALKFYTDFANPAKKVYCWNDTLDNSLDMFIDGKLAFMFGYSYHLPIIKSRAPKLNFGIAPFPQIENTINPKNFGNYWVEVVSKKSDKKNEAWDFIQFISKAENVKQFLNKTKKPTALRSLIKEQLEDDDLKVFASQLLTAKNWYKGHNAKLTEEIMNNMIDRAVNEQVDLGIILGDGARKIQQTIR